MPIFQETHPAEHDTVEKHEITPVELEFLSRLQFKLNTQDKMCQAAPRFWVIKGFRYEYVPTDDVPYHVDFEYDHEEFFDTDDPDHVIACNVKELYSFLVDNYAPKIHMSYDEKKDRLTIVHDIDDDGVVVRNVTTAIDYLGEAKSLVNELTGRAFDTVYVVKEPYVYPNTLFFTHESCENHLAKYARRYDDEAHAYAMTAQESPEIELLMAILQTVDWSKVHLTEGMHCAPPAIIY